MIPTYYVGARPKEPLRFKVRDSAGDPVNILQYPELSMRMLDSRNREIDLSEGYVLVTNPELGEALFVWPPESPFKRAGEYVLQLVLAGADHIDFTTEAHVLVKEMGVY